MSGILCVVACYGGASTCRPRNQVACEGVGVYKHVLAHGSTAGSTWTTCFAAAAGNNLDALVVACSADDGDAVVEEDVSQDDDAADITSQVKLTCTFSQCSSGQSAVTSGCYAVLLPLLKVLMLQPSATYALAAAEECFESFACFLFVCAQAAAAAFLAVQDSSSDDMQLAGVLGGAGAGGGLGGQQAAAAAEASPVKQVLVSTVSQ